MQTSPDVPRPSWSPLARLSVQMYCKRRIELALRLRNLPLPAASCAEHARKPAPAYHGAYGRVDLPDKRCKLDFPGQPQAAVSVWRCVQCNCQQQHRRCLANKPLANCRMLPARISMPLGRFNDVFQARHEDCRLSIVSVLICRRTRVTGTCGASHCIVRPSGVFPSSPTPNTSWN